MDLKEGVAIYGGTFDPVHNGHLRVLGTITKLPFIMDTYIHVTFSPEYKKPVAGFSDRVQMAKIAFNGIERIRIVEGSGFKYTSTMVKWLRKSLKCPIYLFTGAEWDLRKFHDSKTVMKNVWQILIPDDCNYDQKDPAYKKEGAVWLNLTHIIPCHSVYIRHAIENNLPIDGLVPQSVIKYIKNRRIYEKLSKTTRNS